MHPKAPLVNLAIAIGIDGLVEHVELDITVYFGAFFYGGIGLGKTVGVRGANSAAQKPDQENGEGAATTVRCTW